MTEILTESFCERCGTRYTFESARPKTRLKGVKVLSRGLKNFVLSDDTSIDEAMAAARSETDREATAHQLDAFHKTFNFCMSCRQYTCPNCWNEAEVRCLSCAPLELPEAPVRLEDLGAFGGPLIGEAMAPNGMPAAHDHDAWAETVEATAAPAGAETEPEAAEGAALAAAETTLEPEVVEAEPAAAVEADTARKAAAQTTGLLKRFRPGQSLDAELDAYERERAQAVAPEGVPAEQAEAPEALRPEEPSAGATPVDVEPVEMAVETPEAPEAAAPEALAAAEPELAAEPDVAAAADAAAAEAAAPARDTGMPAGAGADRVEQPTWRITAPDPGTTTPVPPTAPDSQIPLQASATPHDAGAEPQWPARPEWPAASSSPGLPFLGRPAAGQGGIEALWAASNQELVTAPPAPGRPASSGIQPCVSCGLSLSATARFCRRCGTLQGR